MNKIREIHCVMLPVIRDPKILLLPRGFIKFLALFKCIKDKHFTPPYFFLLLALSWSTTGIKGYPHQCMFIFPRSTDDLFHFPVQICKCLPTPPPYEVNLF